MYIDLVIREKDKQLISNGPEVMELYGDNLTICILNGTSGTRYKFDFD